MRSLLLAIGSLMLPISAKAVLIEVEFEGIVTSTIGAGFGYAVGDSVSGALYINPELAPADSDPAANASNFFNNNVGDAGFVTGFTTSSTRSIDLVFLSDGEGFDQFVVNDNEFTQIDATSARQDLLNVRAVAEVDFLSGPGLYQHFELAGTAGLTGQFLSRLATTIDGVTQFSQRNLAAFEIRYLRVSPVTVPEPATLLLLGAGLFGIALTRRYRAA